MWFCGTNNSHWCVWWLWWWWRRWWWWWWGACIERLSREGGKDWTLVPHQCGLHMPTIPNMHSVDSTQCAHRTAGKYLFSSLLLLGGPATPPPLREAILQWPHIQVTYKIWSEIKQITVIIQYCQHFSYNMVEMTTDGGCFSVCV